VIAIGAGAAYFGIASIVVELVIMHLPCFDTRHLYRLMKFQTISLETADHHVKQQIDEMHDEVVTGEQDVVPTASGLKWLEMKWLDAGVAPKGTELTNKELSKALTRKTEFTQKEWNAFGIHVQPERLPDYFIQSLPGKYFQPLEETKRQSLMAFKEAFKTEAFNKDICDQNTLSILRARGVDLANDSPTRKTAATKVPEGETTSQERVTSPRRGVGVTALRKHIFPTLAAIKSAKGASGESTPTSTKAHEIEERLCDSPQPAAPASVAASVAAGVAAGVSAGVASGAGAGAAAIALL